MIGDHARFDVDRVDTHRFTTEVLEPHVNPVGVYYGGQGQAATIAAAEATCGRPLVWATTQFLAPVWEGDVLEIEVEELVRGHASSQTQVSARRDGQLVITTLTAHSERSDHDRTAWGTMPDVPPPEVCDRFLAPAIADGERCTRYLERRFAIGRIEGTGPYPPLPDAALSVWGQRTDGPLDSAAALAYVADAMPMALSGGLGLPPMGTSLDNTMRIISTEPHPWVLMEISAQGISRSMGHGTVKVWSPDGHLLAVATQTALMKGSRQSRPAP